MTTTYATRWLSPAEVAAYLGQSRQSVYRKIRSGALPTPVRLTPDGPLRISEDELAAWLEARRQDTQVRERGSLLLAPRDPDERPDEPGETTPSSAGQSSVRRRSRGQQGRNDG